VINSTMHRQVLIRVTIQAVARISTQRNGINNFLPRAIVASCTGTGTVSGDIVLGPLDLGPRRNHVTGAAQLARSIKGQIASTFGNSMGVGHMDAIKVGTMTGRAVTSGSEVLTDGTADQSTVSIVTAGAVIVNLRVGRVSERRRIAVTVRTTASTDLNQGIVTRNIGGVGHNPAISVTGRAVSAGRKGLADRQADQAAVASVTTAAAAMGLSCGTGQGVVMTVCTIGCCNLNQSTVVRSIAAVGQLPTAGMTGRTFSTSGEVLTNGTADQAAVDIVTTVTFVVVGRIAGISQWRRIIVTITTTARGNRNQAVVTRGIGGMGYSPGVGVTNQTITTTSRNARLQSGHGCVTEGTIIQMDSGNCSVENNSRIVTAQTIGRTTGNITGHIMIRTMNSQFLVRMAIQTGGRIRRQRDGIDDLLPRTGVTGFTRSRAVGRNVMQRINLR